MKVFEYHFNPSAKADRFFHAAFQERQFPETQSSEHFAFLGELDKALPQNSNLVKRVADVAKKEFISSEHAQFSKAVQKFNSALSSEKKSGNVDWIGNFHASLVGFSQKHGQDKARCAFTKTGSTKIFVARKGVLTDAGKEIQDTEYMGSGTLHSDDKVLLMTRDAYKTFSDQNILHDLVFFKEDRQFKELFRAKAKELAKLSGALLVVCVDSATPEEKRKRPLLPFFTEWTFSPPFGSFAMLDKLPFRKEITIVLSFLLVLAVGALLFK
ncbi:MAG: hypothetical protein HYT50_01215 [Candidatus Wildermuthbacteria bacterium]|nr:hypothetical protein [Candidatus Wildermuthbacteria bacterium]